MECPCGTELELAECCGPILAGAQPAPTPEALMRSRYTAYAQKNVPYIIASHDPETRAEIDEPATREWAASTEWLGLSVLATQDGEQEEEGVVEFVARFRDDRGLEHSHHERSRFIRRDGRWFYRDGELVKQAPVKRNSPKVGRNDPCPCGSGKKYKKCHG